MSDENYPATTPSRRYRPRKTVSPGGEAAASDVLTSDFEGVAASYGGTRLFIGYEVDGLMEITVYPEGRFPYDDRVQGHLGYVHVPPGTPWPKILAGVDAVREAAHANYRLAVSGRSAETRAHGAGYEAAYEAITDVFRESWHGLAVRLRREGEAVKEDVRFKGEPPGPVLVTWRGDEYTLMVFPTGSILLLVGDRRDVFG